MVGKLNRRKFGVGLSIVSVSRLLTRHRLIKDRT